MRTIILILFLFGRFAHAATFSGSVVAVSTGDSLTVTSSNKKTFTVRLHGIRAPDSNQAFSQSAKRELSTLVLHQSVSVDVRSNAGHGHFVGRVFVGKLPVNVEMVRRGFAWWYRDEAKNDRELEAAELDAMRGGRGVWGKPPEDVPRDNIEAGKWYANAADRGDVEAQYILGVRYHNGQGVPKDPKDAAKLIRRAAEKGLPNAQAYLGSLYRTGDGVPKDSAEAAKWFRNAALQNQRHAQASLGSMYSTGEGVAKDLVLAHLWLKLAGTQGDESSQRALAAIEAEMTPEQKTEAMKLEREFTGKFKNH